MKKDEGKYQYSKSLLWIIIVLMILIIGCLIVCLLLSGCSVKKDDCGGGTCPLVFVNYFKFLISML